MKTSLNDSFNICHKSQNDERMLNELRNTNKNRIYLASHTENVSLLLYFPQNYKKRKENYRCLYYIHSGDLIHGIALDRLQLQQKADFLGCIVVAIDYMMSPQDSFSTLLDCFTGFEWIIHNSHNLNIELKEISIMGVGFGGGLAAALNLYITHRSEYHVKRQILLYPIMNLFLKQSEEESSDNLIESLPDSFQNFSLLAPTYIFMSAFDLFYTEIFQYIEKLSKSNIKVTLDTLDPPINLLNIKDLNEIQKTNNQFLSKLKKFLYE